MRWELNHGIFQEVNSVQILMLHESECVMQKESKDITIEAVTGIGEKSEVVAGRRLSCLKSELLLRMMLR
jgi:hypothetical protein